MDEMKDGHWWCHRKWSFVNIPLSFSGHVWLGLGLFLGILGKGGCSLCSFFCTSEIDNVELAYKIPDFAMIPRNK